MLCENLDLAIIIYIHPQATLQQKEQAGAYITLWWIGHAAGAAGLVFSGYGEVIEIGRKTLEALEGCHDPVPPLPGEMPPPVATPPPLGRMPDLMPPPFPADPTEPPGPGWEWHGSGPPGSNQGGWFNPDALQSLHPDLDNPAHEPHYDYNYRGSHSDGWRYYPDGRLEPK
jgi:hypothetical protein